MLLVSLLHLRACLAVPTPDLGSNKILKSRACQRLSVYQFSRSNYLHVRWIAVITLALINYARKWQPQHDRCSGAARSIHCDLDHASAAHHVQPVLKTLNSIKSEVVHIRITFRGRIINQTWEVYESIINRTVHLKRIRNPRSIGRSIDLHAMEVLLNVNSTNQSRTESGINPKEPPTAREERKIRERETKMSYKLLQDQWVAGASCKNQTRAAESRSSTTRWQPV
jgi:DNA-binding protein